MLSTEITSMEEIFHATASLDKVRSASSSGFVHTLRLTTSMGGIMSMRTIHCKVKGGRTYLSRVHKLSSKSHLFKFALQLSSNSI